MVSRIGVGALHRSPALERSATSSLGRAIGHSRACQRGWRPRSDDAAFVTNIGELEHRVLEHKVFDIREPALLEHRRGYVFLRSGLVHESMTYWTDDTGPTPKGYADYLRWLVNKHPITFIPEAVSLRARWEGNFWHFQNNVLRKLIAVDELGLADGVPLLVGQALWESCAFAEVRTLPAFRTRNWVLHDRPIRTDRLVIALEGSYRRANMVVAQENLERRSTSPSSTKAPPSCPPRDLFVVVDQPKIERHLENEQDLAVYLGSRGFAVFHSEARSLDDRIRTIRAACCVVLSGGAGVASLVHRIGMPTGIVEIVPADKELAEPYAAWFCREFDLSYRVVVGSPVSPSGNFTVDVAAVMRVVDEVREDRPDRVRTERNRDPQAPGPVAARHRLLDHAFGAAAPLLAERRTTPLGTSARPCSLRSLPS